MRGVWKAAAVAALLVAMLLAGCAEAPAPPPVPAPAVDPVIEQETFEAQVYVTAHGGCTGGVCSGGSYPSVIYQASEDASIRSIAFDIAKLDYEDRPVEWKLTCVAPDDEDPGCLRPLAHGQEPLPAHVEVTMLHLTPETELWLEVTVPPIVTPIVDTFATILMGDAQVSGTLHLLMVGNATASADDDA
jgi:hypothetical protein